MAIKSGMFGMFYIFFSHKLKGLTACVIHLHYSIHIEDKTTNADNIIVIRQMVIKMIKTDFVLKFTTRLSIC